MKILLQIALFLDPLTPPKSDIKLKLENVNLTDDYYNYNL